MYDLTTRCTAFEGSRCISTGELAQVALAAKAANDRSGTSQPPVAVLVFEDATSEVIELDWRGSPDEFGTRLAHLFKATANTQDRVERDESGHLPDTVPDESPRRPGRPRLGVVPREVTLLPRHWDWLSTQRGGASVTLRKLVDDARRSSEVKDRVRRASAIGYKFMSTMAGHEPGFEEASRALFAGDRTGFEAQIAHWPADVQAHLNKVLAEAFTA